MKLYQLVSATDGTRTQVFSVESFERLAQLLAPKVQADSAFGSHYVLVLVEDADGEPYPSRAPMMRVDSVVATFGDN